MPYQREAQLVLEMWRDIERQRNVPVIAGWVGIPMAQIVWPGQPTATSEGRSTPEVVEVHLRGGWVLAGRTPR